MVDRGRVGGRGRKLGGGLFGVYQGRVSQDCVDRKLMGG
jgi:hypothetical protein